MADFYSQEAPATASPAVQRSGNAIKAKLRRTVSTFVCAGQAIGSRLMLPVVPKGARGVYHVLTPSATMGATATLALGITGTTGKYRAAAVLTSTSPETVKSAAHLAAELTADEEQFLTVAAAALPNGGEILAVETFYTLTD